MLESAVVVHDTTSPPSAFFALIAVGVVAPDPPRVMTSEGWLLSREPSTRMIIQIREEVESSVQFLPLKKSAEDMVSVVDDLVELRVSAEPIDAHPLAEELSQSLPTSICASRLLLPSLVNPLELIARVTTTSVAQTHRAAVKNVFNPSSLNVDVVPAVLVCDTLKVKSLDERVVDVDPLVVCALARPVAVPTSKTRTNGAKRNRRRLPLGD